MKKFLLYRFSNYFTNIVLKTLVETRVFKTSCLYIVLHYQQPDIMAYPKILLKIIYHPQ